VHREAVCSYSALSGLGMAFFIAKGQNNTCSTNLSVESLVLMLAVMLFLVAKVVL